MSFSAQELLRAQAVQNAALPSGAPPLQGLNVALRSLVADGLSGDFHLVLTPPSRGQERSGRACLVVGDVSGKGLAASLTATSVGHLLPWLNPTRHPFQALRALNQELLKRTPSDAFASLVLAEADARNGTLRLWSAGHPPALLWRAASGTVEVLGTDTNALPLGCFAEWQGAAQTCSWAVGDILVLYSDGLIETRDPKGEMFGINEAVQTIQSLPANADAETAAALLQEAALAWGAVRDDTTILACQYTGTVPPDSPSPGDAPAAPVGVLLVDDHAIWRDGIRSVLEDTEFAVIGEAASGPDAVAQARTLRPDLVLLDISMPGGDGLAALAGIQEQVPPAVVVMLTTYDNPYYKTRALKAGAAAYLLKGMGRDDLLTALRAVLRTGDKQP